MPIRCLIVDDHTLFSAGLRRLLETEPGIEVVAEAGRALDALDAVHQHNPDVVLMDISMPGMSSFDAAQQMRSARPATRVIFLTMHDDEEFLRQGLAAGASGYLLKDEPAAKLITAVQEVHRGHRAVSHGLLNKLGNVLRSSLPGKNRGPNLTPREQEVIKFIAEGNSVREIAGRLNLSAKTVEVHKFNLMRKLGIHNKAQLVTYAIQKRIVKLPVGA